MVAHYRYESLLAPPPSREPKLPVTPAAPTHEEQDRCPNSRCSRLLGSNPRCYICTTHQKGRRDGLKRAAEIAREEEAMYRASGKRCAGAGNWRGSMSDAQGEIAARTVAEAIDREAEK